MPDKIDMALDDIIKSDKAAKRGGIGGRGGRGGIGSRFNNNQRNGNRSLNRRSYGAGGSGGGASSGGIQKRRSGSGGAQIRKPMRVPDGQWSHDMYSGVRRRSASATVGGSVTTGPSKITISNLDFGVNDKDIQDLFEEFGAIKKAAVHYDRTGRSLGTADVVFEKKQDALKAIKKYNGVQLDGRAMNIQITEPIGAQQATAVAATASAGSSGRQSFSPRRGGGFRRGGSLGGGGGFRRGFGSGPRRGGRGGGARRGGPGKTAAELDADLDSYASKMQTD